MNNIIVLVLVCACGHVISQDVANTNFYCYGSPTPSKSDGDLVAFSVASSTRFAPAKPSRVPFEITIYNDGGYFRHDNAFHAPTKGVYSFSFSGVADAGKRMSIHLYTQRTGQDKFMVGRAFDNSPGAYWGGAGASVIVKLEAGETVSVWLWGDGGNTVLLGSANEPWSRATLFSGKLERRLE